jgi:hypothetical protein
VTFSSLKRGALALGGAALLLSATVGFSAAQSTTPDKKQQQQAVINLAASKLGLTGDQLSEALKQSRKDLGHNQGRPKIAKLVKQELGVAATTLGYSDVKALRKDLAGTTLAALAQTRKIAPATVASAIKADVDSQIQALAAAGTIKPNQAVKLKLKAEARVDGLMTRQFKVSATP